MIDENKLRKLKQQKVSKTHSELQQITIEEMEVLHNLGFSILIQDGQIIDKRKE